MRILVAHNEYQITGGEDVVFANECAMLERQGHDVRRFLVSNTEITDLMSKLSAAVGVVFSLRRYREFRKLLKEWRPHIVHVHNFFPLLSPAIFYACKAERLPVVMTLHNFRIVCPTALLLHDGHVCERSISDGPWWAVRHGVYRGSRFATAMLAMMVSVHRLLGTWNRKVDRFIVLSHFARGKFVQAGLSPQLLVYKPNFITSELPRDSGPRASFLFVGRLSREKGVSILAAAASQLSPPTSVLVAGEGPEIEKLAHLRHVQLMGRLGRSEIAAHMGRAIALIVPSICNEMFGLVVIEAFACGTPVIASRIGALTDLVEDGITGLLVDPGNPIDLHQKMAWAQAHPEQMEAMGRAARQRYQALYTEDVNYRRLLEIYQEAIQEGGSMSKTTRAGVLRMWGAASRQSNGVRHEESGHRRIAGKRCR